jgi:hypothetical protein
MATEDDDFRIGYYGEAFKRFEELGETTVRWMFSHNKIVPQDWQAASVWLEAKERRTISTQERALAAAETEAAAAVKQAKIAARSAANAKWLAITAIVISAITVAVAVIGLMIHPG